MKVTLKEIVELLGMKNTAESIRTAQETEQDE